MISLHACVIGLIWISRILDFFTAFVKLLSNDNFKQYSGNPLEKPYTTLLYLNEEVGIIVMTLLVCIYYLYLHSFE